VDLIQTHVSNYYNIPRVDLISMSRSRSLVHARQVAMYLCRELAGETLISIGDRFGGRHHATVIHSCRNVETMLKQRKDVLQEVRELTNIINRSC
jgi:chromosomal replication initiator protein